MTTDIDNKSSLNALGNLIKLLPTGTVFTFRFLSPVLSNNGHCHRENKYLMGVLLALCGLSCAFSTFTDSHVDEEGKTHYGVATLKGMWKLRSKNLKRGHPHVDLAEYRLRMRDFVHAMMGFLIFGVVAVLDSNTMDCFAPNWRRASEGVLVMLRLLPLVVGGFSSVVFAVFPSLRNGIGYPSMVNADRTMPKDNSNGSKDTSNGSKLSNLT